MFEKYNPAVNYISFNETSHPAICFSRSGRKATFFKSSIDQVFEYHGSKIVWGQGTEFGENVIIEPNVIIGRDCFIGHNTVVRNGTVIGNNCMIGSLVLIEECVKVGDNSTIQSQCSITKGTFLGKNVFLGPCVVCANDKQMVKYHPERGAFDCNAPVFMDKCSIGAGSHILPGVTIGEDAVIGTGSTVTISVPEGQVWIGQKAKPRKNKNGVFCLCNEVWRRLFDR